MRLVLIGLAALACAMPAAEAQAQQSVYDQGVAARLAGENKRAVELLKAAVDAEPSNADAWLNYGLALMAEGRLPEADRAFRRTLELAPDYGDARDALARLDARQSAAPAHQWRVDLDGSYSAVEQGRPDWKEGSLQVRYQADEATAVTGLLEASRRFGLGDVYGELRLDRALADGAGVWLSLGGTPNADYRPEWQIGLGGALRIREGANATVLTVEGRQARYASGDIQTLVPGIEQYVGGGSWLTARMINIFDETGRHRSGWLVRGDVMATPGLRLFAGAADAPDVSEGVVTDIFSVFGGLSFDLNERQTIRLSLAHEDRDSGADRLQLGLGLGVRF